MAERRNRRVRRPRGIPRIADTNRKRILMLGFIFCFLIFVVLGEKLWSLQVTRHEDLQKQAYSQQTRKTVSTASRGTIYDRNGTVLAISGSVQNIVLSPRDLNESVEVDEVDEFGNPRSQAVIDAEKAQLLKDTTTNIVDFLSKTLDVPPAEIQEKLQKTNSAYAPVATKVEDDLAQQVQNFIDENGYSKYLYMTDDSKRYYPYSSLACQVIGFVNSNGDGSYGLEAIFEDALSGTDGLSITSKNASGREMMSNYSSRTNVVNGYDLNLTIDSTIQMYAEQTLREGISQFYVQNGGFCVVMEPKTGAVLALASIPNYNPNNPTEIIDADLIAKLANKKKDKTITDEEYEKALGEAQFSMWRSKALNDSYEPGSTFKPMVVAAALDEGVVTEDSMFHCSGAVQIDGWNIRCSARRGHGTQNLRKALMNSCNPALIAIGQALTADKFYEYWENFGFTSKTGIELQGESNSIFWDRDTFVNPAGLAYLATASFGQRFQVTPIQLITAFCSVVNGGYLMEPYVVQSITDSDGNVVSYHEPTAVRQVVSEETSALMRSMLRSVVEGPNGTGKNARVYGYSIGGKTGSSQTLETNTTGRVIVSFMGVAPAEDPDIVVLLAYDFPKPVTPDANKTPGGTYISGGNMAAPKAGQLMANILDYLGYQESTANVSNCGLTIPDITGNTLDEAINAVGSLGMNYRVLGTGSVVTDQAPSAGSSIPAGSCISIYLGEEKVNKTVAMPDLTGMTYEQAIAAMDEVGLYVDTDGTEGDTVFSQSVKPGVILDTGTVVEVRFADAETTDAEAQVDRR